MIKLIVKRTLKEEGRYLAMAPAGMGLLFLFIFFLIINSPESLTTTSAESLSRLKFILSERGLDLEIWQVFLFFQGSFLMAILHAVNSVNISYSIVQTEIRSGSLEVYLSSSSKTETIALKLITAVIIVSTLQFLVFTLFAFVPSYLIAMYKSAHPVNLQLVSMNILFPFICGVYTSVMVVFLYLFFPEKLERRLTLRNFIFRLFSIGPILVIFVTFMIFPKVNYMSMLTIFALGALCVALIFTSFVKKSLTSGAFLKSI